MFMTAAFVTDRAKFIVTEHVLSGVARQRGEGGYK